MSKSKAAERRRRKANGPRSAGLIKFRRIHSVIADSAVAIEPISCFVLVNPEERFPYFNQLAFYPNGQVVQGFSGFFISLLVPQAGQWLHKESLL